MKKQLIIMAGVIIIFVLGIITWRETNKNDKQEDKSLQQKQQDDDEKKNEEKNTIVKEEDMRKMEDKKVKWEQENSKVNTSNWKSYSNEEFGIGFNYPPKYEIKEEPGLIHFYHNKCAFSYNLPEKDCININIIKEKNPESVHSIDELWEHLKNAKADGGRSQISAKKMLGKNEFIVTEFFHNSGTFYAVSFVAVKKSEYVVVSFGLMSNIIEENDYNEIKKIMESFKVL